MAFGANTAGATFIDIRGDLSGFRRDLVSAQGIAVAGGDRIGSSLHRRMASWNQRIGASIGRGIRTGLQVGTVAIGAWSAYSIKAASDVGEQINRTNVVFGKNREVILEWSKDTADAFGISRAESLEAAASFGTMLDTAGLAQDEIAPMSSSLVELAADMASFNNQDPSEMLTRLRSGLAGEAEPLRRFGVFISEAALQTQAFKDGIAEQGEELTDAQKVQARYNLILEQTTKQQGDFARTSESMPNQMRRLKASFADASSELGRKLLPMATKIVTWLADELPPALKNVEKFLRDWSGAWDETMKDIGDGFGWLLGKIADWVEFFTDAAGKILTAAAYAFGWLPKIGDQLNRAKDEFNLYSDSIVAGLRKQEARFKGWGEATVTATDAAERGVYSIGQEASAASGKVKGLFGALIGLKGAANIGIDIGIAGDGPGRGGTAVAWARAAIAAVPGNQWISSTYRTPAENARVGGSPTSYHMDRSNPAADIVGENLDGIAAFLSARYQPRELLWRVPGHYDHVHVADLGAIVKGPALIAQGNITEAHIPLTGPGAKGLSISGTLDIPGIGRAILRGATLAINAQLDGEDNHARFRQPA